MESIPENMDSIAAQPLFAGLSRGQLEALLAGCRARIESFHTGAVAVRQGELARDISLVLRGRFEGVVYSPDGAAAQLTQMPKGALFGELISGANAQSPVSVVALEHSLALMIPFENLVTQPPENAATAAQVLRNLMGEIATRYFALLSRINVLTAGSLRRKICVWLEGKIRREGLIVRVPRGREELARYLGCERSALSRELSRMRAEGIIEYDRKTVRVRLPDTVADIAG